MALSDKLQQLKDAGFDVPENALSFAKDQEYEQDNVKCVWKCKCGLVYKSPVPLGFYDHGCGKSAKKVWPRI